MKLIAICLAIFSVSAFSSDTIERLSTPSLSYDARNIFNNPAAFGYQTALNGAELLSGFQYGVQSGLVDEMSYALSYGYLGGGWEHLNQPGGKSNRFSLALSTPLGPYLYWGARLRLVRFNGNSGADYNSTDLGFQIRPSRVVSFGLLFNGINRPLTNSGTSLPMDTSFGVTVRPAERLELSADITTPSNAFFKQVDWQVLGGFEVADGVKLRAGYHSREEVQFGLAIQLGRASLYSTGQVSSTRKSLVTGWQFSITPRRSVVTAKSSLKIEVDSSLSEAPVSGSFLTKSRPAFARLIDQLEDARKEESVARVLIRLDGFPLGWAAAEDLHESILALKQAGKHVSVFLGNTDLREYFIASAANRIHLEPTAEIRFAGLSVGRYYLKGTLDKIGIEGEFLARGKYKSAPETFTRTSASPDSKEATLSELKEAERLIIARLEKARGIDKKKWDALLKEALLSADQAKDAGLVDEVSRYSADIETEEKSHKMLERVQFRSDELKLPDRVAVVVADGSIMPGKLPILSWTGNAQVTPDRFEKHMKAALSDPRTKAIVVRVSSPGGHVLASDQIGSLIENARAKKPVYISMGDVAASGGYLIAAPANRIFAQDLTLTGSIGVFLGKPNLAGLYKKIDLNKEILSFAPFAGLMTENRPWSKEEVAIMTRRLDQYYDTFVKFVAKHRTLSVADAEKSAQGRVWLGSEALARKLVDERGGLLQAVKAAAIAGETDPERAEMWVVQDSRSLLDLVSGNDDAFLESSDQLGVVGRAFPKDALYELDWLLLSRQHPFLYLSPQTRIE